jgi:hypothetical protein
VSDCLLAIVTTIAAAGSLCVHCNSEQEHQPRKTVVQKLHPVSEEFITRHAAQRKRPHDIQ